MLTVCKSTVLAAAFLAGVAIAANADSASTSAAGTVANPAGGSLTARPRSRGSPAVHRDAGSKQRNTAGDAALPGAVGF
jgi:hypothetical protein